MSNSFKFADYDGGGIRKNILKELDLKKAQEAALELLEKGFWGDVTGAAAKAGAQHLADKYVNPKLERIGMKIEGLGAKPAAAAPAAGGTAPAAGAPPTAAPAGAAAPRSAGIPTPPAPKKFSGAERHYMQALGWTPEQMDTWEANGMNDEVLSRAEAWHAHNAKRAAAPAPAAPSATAAPAGAPSAASSPASPKTPPVPPSGGGGGLGKIKNRGEALNIVKNNPNLTMEQIIQIGDFIRSGIDKDGKVIMALSPTQQAAIQNYLKSIPRTATTKSLNKAMERVIKMDKALDNRLTKFLRKGKSMIKGTFPDDMPEYNDNYEMGNNAEVQLKPENQIDAAEYQMGNEQLPAAPKLPTRGMSVQPKAPSFTVPDTDKFMQLFNLEDEELQNNRGYREVLPQFENWVTENLESLKQEYDIESVQDAKAVAKELAENFIEDWNSTRSNDARREIGRERALYEKYPRY